MKVIHVMETGGEAYGVERTVSTLLAGLARQGLDVRAAVVAETRAGGLSAAAAERLKATGCPFDIIETASRFPFGIASRLRRLFDREKPDVVHSHGYKIDLAVLLSRTRAATVTTVHGWCSRSAKERFYEWLGVQCEKRMDAVIALCEDYRRRLIRRGVRADRIRVVHVGTDPAALPSSGRDCRAEWGVGRDEVLIVQVGRLSPEKNPALFIEAAKRLAPRLPQARFVLVGDGSLMAPLRALAGPLGDRLVFAGYVKDVGCVFSAADIVVNCSTTEGLPGVLLEAGAMGLPAVATAVGGVSEIIDEGVTGFLCASGDTEAVAAAIERLVQDPALRRSMGDAARKRIGTDFTIDACAKQLLKVYEDLVA